MDKILVIGSISVDNVTYTKVLPQPGTTVIGENFLSNIGGKGANQACAATFLGSDVFFFGAVGKDENGNRIVSFLREQGLKGSIKRSSQPTGIASITLDTSNSENRIVIVPGANMDLIHQDVEYALNKSQANILLIQLENPAETVCFALKRAKEMGLTTILNPAPYHELPEDVFPFIDYFVPNEHELDSFVQGDSLTYEEKAKCVIRLGCKNVIVTLGDKGSLWVNAQKSLSILPHPVQAVDTTAAGDSFLGAFVTALSQHKEVIDALNFASLCSSFTVTKKGAIASLPKLEDIETE